MTQHPNVVQLAAVTLFCSFFVATETAQAQALTKVIWFPLSEGVTDMTLSPDGKIIACVGSLNGIELIDRVTGKEICNFGTFRRSPVRFTPDGSTVFHWHSSRLSQKLGLSDWETLVDLYTVKTKKLRKRLKLTVNHGVGDNIVAVDNNTLLVGGKNEVATFYDIDTGKQTGKIAGKHQPYRLEVSKDGKWMLTAGVDNTLCLWDVKKKTIVHELYDHTTKVLAIAISPDGKWCASATSDGRLWVFDRDKGKEKGRTPTLFAGSCRTLLFTPDGKTLIAGGRGVDGGLVWWDWQKNRDIRGGLWPQGKTAQALRKMERESARVISAFLAPDGKNLYVANYTPKVKLPPKGGLVIDIWDLSKPFNPNPPKPKAPSPEPKP